MFNKYKLNGLVAAASFALVSHMAWAADETPAEETYTARFQTTYLWQYKPAFDAPYTGTYSLIPQREKSYTFTTTAYLGFRPWKDGELYLDAELTQGVPFSGLVGLGGFTNGEVTRVSGTNPKIYRQRLFLRQTWNRGGEPERVDADLNQMAGFVDRNRFVLTVGNFSTLDVFDKNAYSNNPRTQFMNWAHMNNVAFDYAADARGYSWGFAGEWYHNEWTLRFGRATGPESPNQLPTDYRIFQHYGDQVELEHEHEWNGQPGSVRLLAWRNRFVLASFRDAINYGNSVNWVPDPVNGRQYIVNVREGEKIKYGFGLNMDQAITSSLGVFFKAMWADGRTETVAFTEVDRSMAGGVSIKGAAWGRAQDTVGLALMRHELSKDRREYLELGGLSYFIGDGALRYKPEAIFEGYYSWNVVRGVWLTADYQRVQNPAYNADRGPVNFYGLRFHAEF
jgi:high affinity Mn2+ porin